MASKQKPPCGLNVHSSISGQRDKSHVSKITTSIWLPHVTVKSRLIKESHKHFYTNRVKRVLVFLLTQDTYKLRPHLCLNDIFFNSRTRPTFWYVYNLPDVIPNQVIHFWTNTWMSDGATVPPCGKFRYSSQRTLLSNVIHYLVYLYFCLPPTYVLKVWVSTVWNRFEPSMLAEVMYLCVACIITDYSFWLLSNFIYFLLFMYSWCIWCVHQGDGIAQLINFNFFKPKNKRIRLD